MQIDRYTKLVLTVIALALATIAWRSLVEPPKVAAANLPTTQLAITGSGFWIYDTSGGHIYSYSADGKTAKYLGHITQLGKPLENQDGQ